MQLTQNYLTYFQVDLTRANHALIRNYLYISLSLRHGVRAGLFSNFTLEEFKNCKLEPHTQLYVTKVKLCSFEI